MMIRSFRFDGSAVKQGPHVTLRDTIIARMVAPEELARVQLVYPEEGPDDHWRAACEMLLGAGLEHAGRRYKVLGSSNSIKKGVVWLATDEVRERLHRYFNTAQEALSYTGVFFSGCHHGVHQLSGLHGTVVVDSDRGTADGMGFVSAELLERLGLPLRQLQVRLISDDEETPWFAKGTLMPSAELDGDLVIPTSMVKGAGKPPVGGPWRCWFGVRDIAQARPYASSFSFAQWFDDAVLDAVWPDAEEKLSRIRRALTSRQGALSFLGLLEGDDAYREARSKAEAFLQAGVEPDHPWLHRQLVQLVRRAYVQLALGGGISLTGRMGAWADLPEGVVCIADEPEGPVVLSRYPIRDPHSIQAVWNEPGAVIDAGPGTIYLNNNDALLLDGDFDGDYYITCSQEAVVDAVSSPGWYPEYKREDVPPKTRLADPLHALPYVTVTAIGGVIGSITYAITAALHQGDTAKIAKLSAALQASVQAIKWDTHVDRDLLNDKGLEIPDYIVTAKQDRDLFVGYAEEVAGDFPLIRNLNRVVHTWKRDAHTTRPLVHFKGHLPLWAAPTALQHVEETAAVVTLYNRWIASIIEKVGEPTRDDLTGPLDFLRAWDTSKTDDRNGWAAALWHVTHGSRTASTASAAFHAFSEEMVTLIREHRGVEAEVTVPTPADPSALPTLQTIPLVGGQTAAEEKGHDFINLLRSQASEVTVQTRSNGSNNAAFYLGSTYIGQIPKDHPLYTAIPADLTLHGHLQLRGRTVYLLLEGTDQLTEESGGFPLSASELAAT